MDLRQNIRNWSVGFLIVSEGSLLLGSPVLAQIVPDGTLGSESSVLTPNANIQGQPGDRIDGGALRGSNLFHSFQTFGVEANQRVYFANPAGVQNILSRVTGIAPSNIYGTLGVEGAANLYLLNPNGIVFGPNARLDVQGSFVGSTADRFRFDDGSEFRATDPNAAPLVTVNIPLGPQFSQGTSVALVNQASLTVGQDLSLSGGSVTSTGTLAAPQGTVTVTGVAGDVQVQQVMADAAALSASQTLQLESSQLQTARDLTLAGNTVRIRDSSAAPFQAIAGGDLTLQGNQTLDVFALNHADTRIQSGGDLTLISDSPISADTHLFSGGDVSLLKTDGSLASFLSLEDPIVEATGDVTFAGYTGRSLRVTAGGSITSTGDIVIIGPEVNDEFTGPFLAVSPTAVLEPSDADLFDHAALILEAGQLVEPGNSLDGFAVTNPPTNPATITVQNILAKDIESGTNRSGLIFLGTAGGAINLQGSTITAADGANGPGTVTLDGPVNLGQDLTITASYTEFSSTVDGVQSLAIRRNPIPDGEDVFLSGGDVAFGGNVGGNTSLTALTVEGYTSLNADSITTSGKQTYEGPVYLGGNPTLIANDFAFSEEVSGFGTLSLLPFNADRKIAINGNNDPNTMDISEAELNLLQGSLYSESSTFDQVIIGKADGTGPIVVGEAGPIVLTTDSSSEGPYYYDFSPYDLTLQGGTIDFQNGLQLAPDSTLTLRANNVTNNSPITAVTTAGSGLLKLETSGDVGTFANPLSIESTLGDSTIGGQLHLISGNTLRQAGGSSIAVAGAAALTSTQTAVGDVSITSQSNLTLGETLVGGNLDLQLVGSADTVSQTALSTVKVAGEVTTSGVTNLDLNNPANLVQGTFLNQGGPGNVLLVKAGMVDLSTDLAGVGLENGLGDFAVEGDLTVRSLPEGFDGNYTDVELSAIVLNEPGNRFGGPLFLKTDAPNIVPVTPGITQSGAAVQVAGTADFNATPQGNIQVDQPANSIGNLAVLGKDVTIQSDRAVVLVDSFLEGTLNLNAGGAITQSGTLQIKANGGLGTSTFNSGNGTSIQLNNPLNQLSGRYAFGTTTTPNTVTLANSLDTQLAAVKASENVQITSQKTLTTSNIQVLESSTAGAAVSTVTLNAAGAMQILGDITTGGNVTLNAPQITLDNAAISTRNGNITLQTPTFVAQNQSRLTTTNQADPVGGSVVFNALQTFTLADSAIATTTERGQAGNVSLNLGQPAVAAATLNNSTITTEARMAGGRSGEVVINAANLTSTNSQIRSANVTDPDGGNVHLRGLNALTAVNSSLTTATGSGVGGDIIVEGNSPANRVDLTRSTLATTANGGTAGGIFVNARQLNLRDGSQLSVSSPSGSAGNLVVATTDGLLDNSSLTASVGQGTTGEGGNVDVTVANILLLRNESLIATRAANPANGGSIRVNGGFVIGLDPTGSNGSDVVAAVAGGGRGAIAINTNGVIGLAARPAIPNNQTNDIDGITEGVVTVDLEVDRPPTPESLSTELAAMPDPFRDQCTFSKTGEGSQVTLGGRGGLPSNPTAPLAADSPETDWVFPTGQPEASSPLQWSTAAVSIPEAPLNRRGVAATAQCLEAWSRDQQGQ